MKFIFSPSKEQNFEQAPLWDMVPLADVAQTKELVRRIQKMTKVELSKALSIKGNLLEKTYALYENFGKDGMLPALQAYNGLAYRQMQRENYTVEQRVYMQNHVVLLSALYGPLTPFTAIGPYRLDMKSKIGVPLYKKWETAVEKALGEENVVINLASKEFSKLVLRDLVNINFLIEEKGKQKIVGTYAKKARGQILNFAIENKIEKMENLFSFSHDEWKFLEYNRKTSHVNFIKKI